MSKLEERDGKEGDSTHKENHSLARGQGAESDAEASTGWDEELQEMVDPGDEIDLETDGLMWLDDMDTVSEMNVNPKEDDEKQPVETQDGSVDQQLEAQDEHEAVALNASSVDADQVPDDPDEAIAWLERLAAKQGAPSEELPTVESPVSFAADDIAPPDTMTIDEHAAAGEIPEDPDEAMAWLERLAAKQGADSEELIMVEADPVPDVPDVEVETNDELAFEPETPSLSGDLDEALGWLEELTIPQEPSEEVAEDSPPMSIVEEPPTPAVAHDVAESLAGADLLFAEPASATAAEVKDEAIDEAIDEPIDESQIEDPDDAMAWLEQLAARQGAPIEELTTMDSEADIGEVEIDQALEPSAEASEGVGAQDEFALEPAEADAPVVPPTIAAAPENLVEEPGEEAEPVAPAEVVELDPASQLTEPEAVPETLSPASAEEDTAGPESIAEADVPVEDLAWLDTLGSVDAEGWLEGEAAQDKQEAIPAVVEASDLEPTDELNVATTEPQPAPGILPDAPGSEELTLARQAMIDGAFEQGLATYSALVEKGEFLPFLIDDLEIASQEQGPEPGLQRVLGDAYARNGQLQKALQAYREALDIL